MPKVLGSQANHDHHQQRQQQQLMPAQCPHAEIDISPSIVTASVHKQHHSAMPAVVLPGMRNAGYVPDPAGALLTRCDPAGTGAWLAPAGSCIRKHQLSMQCLFMVSWLSSTNTVPLRAFLQYTHAMLGPC
jgi:hypothetical protein